MGGGVAGTGGTCGAGVEPLFGQGEDGTVVERGVQRRGTEGQAGDTLRVEAKEGLAPLVVKVYNGT